MDVTFQTLYRFCAEGNVIVNIRPLRRVFKSAKQRETNLTFGVTLEVKEVGCYWLAIFYLLLSLCLIAMLASSKKKQKTNLESSWPLKQSVSIVRYCWLLSL